jgi:hypothetical protein
VEQAQTILQPEILALAARIERARECEALKLDHVGGKAAPAVPIHSANRRKTATSKMMISSRAGDDLSIARGALTAADRADGPH